MIDIHTHILPGIDDGPESTAEAIAMMEMASADGITDVVATPHFNNRYSFSRERARSEAVRLQPLCPAVRLHIGCELLLTPENLALVCSAPHLYAVSDGDAVLLELPDPITGPIVRDVVVRLTHARIRPVIVHPERNASMRSELRLVAGLVESGAYIQVTAQSLTGDFGVEARHAAERLLSTGYVHFFASDAHGSSHRRPVLSLAYRRVSDLAGDDAAALLFERNPQALLDGTEVVRVSPSGRKRFWSFLQRKAPTEATYRRHL